MAEYEKFTFDIGSDIAVQLELVDLSGNPKDLSNYSAAAKMKRNYNSDSADTTDFAVAIQPTDGIVTLSLTNQQTNVLRVGNYVYDVEITQTSTGTVTRVIEGIISTRPNVTTS